MKKKLLKLPLLLLSVLLLSSCVNDDEYPEEAYIAFETQSSEWLENEAYSLGIPVTLRNSFLTAKVNFEISTEGLSNPAVEGVDFIVENEENSIVIYGDSYTYIKIKTLDNEVYDGDKQFNIVLTGNSIHAGIGKVNGESAIHTVTISDDEGAGDSYIAFNTNSSEWQEDNSTTIAIPVALINSDLEADVNFEISTDGLSNPAVEGVDFTIENINNTLVVGGNSQANIKIKLIDNEIENENKQFNIVLSSNSINANLGLEDGSNAIHTVTIVDNEFVLTSLIGNDFHAVEQSMATDSDDNQIDAYDNDIELRADTIDGNNNCLLIKGLLGIDQELRLVFDKETRTVSIEESQSYTNIIDTYFGIEIELTFFGWKWEFDEDGQEIIKRYSEPVGTFDLDKQEIVFDAGYLAQITAPETHPYVGKAYTTFVIENCTISKK